LNASLDNNQRRASSLRRLIVSLIAAAISIAFGFLFGLFGYYAISYWALLVAAIWAGLIGLTVRIGQLTSPSFTAPLGLFLAGITLLTALITAWAFIQNDVNLEFEKWQETRQPDSSRKEAMRQFLSEALGDEGATGAAFDLIRYKAHRGEVHEGEGDQSTFVRRGFWAWWCWTIITIALPLAGVAAGVVGSFAAGEDTDPRQQLREKLRLRRARKAAEESESKPDSQSPRMDPPGWTNWAAILRAGARGYLRFLLPIGVTFLAMLLPLDEGRGIFVAFAVSGFWVSAAMGALEPVRSDGFSWSRLGGHFINTLAMLAMFVTFLVAVMPFVILLTAGFDSGPAFALFTLALVFGFIRLWPLYTMRYLYQGEDEGLGNRGWGVDVISAWRLTRAPGTLWRSTLWAIGSTLVLIAAYDWGRLNWPDAVQTGWALIGLCLFLPLGHLVICERAIALRDAQDIEPVLGIVEPQPGPTKRELAGMHDRVDDAVARQARSPEEAERMQDFMDLIPDPLKLGGDAMIAWAKEEQDKKIMEIAAKDPVEWMSFGIRLRRLEWLQNALDAGVDITQPVSLEMPPIVYASGSTPEVLTWLLDHGAEIDAIDRRGATALHATASSGNVENTRWLLSNGANPEAKNHVGLTPLIAACASRKGLKTARILVDAGADLRQLDQYGQGLLVLAASNGHLDIVNWLLRQGLAVDQPVESDSWMSGFTALAMAVRSGHLEVAKALVKAGADRHFVTDKGTTLLMMAAERGRPETCMWLIDIGLNPKAKDENGYDAVTYAEYQDRPNTASAEAIKARIKQL
jgi:ankyrin repeat protein